MRNFTNMAAYRVRCFVHKWRNIRDVLNEKAQAEAGPLFWGMRKAKDSYLEKEDLLAIHRLQIGVDL